MNLRRVLPAVPLFFSCYLLAQSTSATPKTTLLKAGRLLNVRTGQYLLNAGVLIENDKIKEVGPFPDVQAHAAKGASVIDLGEATLLPGLIDCHAHLLDAMGPREPGDNVLQTVAGMSPSARALLGARMAREDLEGGFTSVRVVGHSGVDGDIALRDAINAGWVPGPRIVAAGRKLTPPGGQAVRLNPAVADVILEQEFLQVSGADEARKAVRVNLAYGADVIKVVADAGDRFITTEEMKAIVEEAHRSHAKIAVHARTAVSVKVAVDAGADSIEHGNGITDEDLKVMREKGLFYDLTETFDGKRLRQWLLKSVVFSPQDEERVSAWEKNSIDEAVPRIQRVLKSGVKFAAGSDMWFEYPGKTRGEATALMFEALRDLGVPSADILRAATVNAAELLGWQDKVGAIEPGKLADIIATSDDPLRDITTLQHVRFVMKGGVVVKNDPQ